MSSRPLLRPRSHIAETRTIDERVRGMLPVMGTT